MYNEPIVIPLTLAVEQYKGAKQRRGGRVNTGQGPGTPGATSSVCTRAVVYMYVCHLH